MKFLVIRSSFLSASLIPIFYYTYLLIMEKEKGACIYGHIFFAILFSSAPVNISFLLLACYLIFFLHIFNSWFWFRFILLVVLTKYLLLFP